MNKKGEIEDETKTCIDRISDGVEPLTAGVITTSVLPTSSVEAAEYRKIYADVTAQMGLDGNLYLEIVGDRPDVTVGTEQYKAVEILEANTGG